MTGDEKVWRGRHPEKKRPARKKAGLKRARLKVLAT
jgi:hypothetical protein